MLVALSVVAAPACTRGDASPTPLQGAATTTASSSTWKAPSQPAWPDLPRDAADADRTIQDAEAATQPRSSPPVSVKLRDLGADASRLVAGEDEIATALDAWLRADPKHAGYILFGTTHDSRAQLDAVRAVAVRMKSLWGLALEQFRTAGHWQNAPLVTSADDADLVSFGAATGTDADDAVVWRLRDRQARFDHAAWKYGYLPAMLDLLYAARGAALPVLGCDMPPELHATLADDGTRTALRELHCARALRGHALALAASHLPEGADDDEPPPPERFAVLLGRAHAEPGGLPRFLPEHARVRSVELMGGRARGVVDEEQAALAPTLVVTDPVLVSVGGAAPLDARRPTRPPPATDAQDVLLLPDDVWGGDVDRASDHGVGPGPAGDGLPDRNVLVSSDEPATFAVGDARVQVGPKPEWLSARLGRQAYVFAETRASSPASTERAPVRFVGAIDVPAAGYAEVHFAPKDKAMRITLHTP